MFHLRHILGLSIAAFPSLSAQTLFSDSFDADSSALYRVNATADTRATFAYDYSLDGIPSAPGSAGTRGLKLEANIVSPNEAAAVSVSPLAGNFSGDYRLRFHMWINANGPFPGGGVGSTEFVTAGVGTTGDQVQWTGTGSAPNGTWFAVSGEGGSSLDFRAYSGGTLSAAASGVYAGGTESNVQNNTHPYYAGTFPGGQTAPELQQQNFPQQTGGLAQGTVGFAWRDVQVEKVGNTVTWSIDGLRIATVTDGNMAGNNVFVGYWDPFSSLSDNAALSFGVIDNLNVEVIPEPSTVVLGSLGAVSLLLLRKRR